MEWQTFTSVIGQGLLDRSISVFLWCPSKDWKLDMVLDEAWTQSKSYTLLKTTLYLDGDGSNVLLQYIVIIIAVVYTCRSGRPLVKVFTIETQAQP